MNWVLNILSFLPISFLNEKFIFVLNLKFIGKHLSKTFKNKLHQWEEQIAKEEKINAFFYSKYYIV